MTETQLPPTAPPTAAAVWEDALLIRDAYRRLAATDWGALGDGDVEGLVLLREEITRMEQAALAQPLVRQVVDRGIPAGHGCSSPVSDLRQLLHIRAGEAKARVRPRRG